MRGTLRYVSYLRKTRPTGLTLSLWPMMKDCSSAARTRYAR